jgi:hypothetical protein
MGEKAVKDAHQQVSRPALNKLIKKGSPITSFGLPHFVSASSEKAT